MNNKFLKYFEYKGKPLHYEQDYLYNDNIKVPVVNSIPRFTPDKSYSTGNFSRLREEFATLQLDSKNDTSIREETILKRTKWPRKFFKNKTILECGVGAGPDTEILLKFGSKVIGVDIAGVDVAAKNLGRHKNLMLVQASIEDLPFKKKSFDIVFCHRVLQHTPDPEKALSNMLRYVKDDGAVFVHSYSRSFRQIFRWKYALRPITVRMNDEVLFRVIKAYSRPAYYLTKKLNSFLVGRAVTWFFIPFLNYNHKDAFKGKTDEYLIDYGIHDTFDALSARYDRPIKMQAMRKIAKKSLKMPFEVVECGVTLLRSVIDMPDKSMAQRLVLNNYFIKKDYLPNYRVQTSDDISQNKYWNKTKIRSSYFYQFYVYRYLVGLYKRTRGDNIVDVGCGVGTKLGYIHEQLPEVEIIGIDQKNAIDYCKSNYDFGTWYSDDFEKPYNPKIRGLKTNLVVCADVIEHILDPDRLVSYIDKILKPGGYLVLSTPERDILRGKNCNYSPNKYHIREWNKTELKKYFKSKGYLALEEKMLFPVKIGLNRFFISYLVKRARYFIRNGLSFRSSQLLVLRKVK